MMRVNKGLRSHLSCFFLHKIGGLSINVFLLKILSHSFLKERDIYYLCRTFKDALRIKAAAQQNSSELGSAFALHFICTLKSSGKRKQKRLTEWRRKLRLPERKWRPLYGFCRHYLFVDTNLNKTDENKFG